MDMRRLRAVKIRIIGQFQLGRLPPATEADKNMWTKTQVAFEVIRHGWTFHAQHLLRSGLSHPLHSTHGRLELAQKHRAIDHEMVIVLAIAGIDVERAPLLIELEVGLDRRLIPVHHVLVMPTQNIYVRWHVDQVPGIGHQPAQRIAGLQRLFRKGRHFH